MRCASVFSIALCSLMAVACVDFIDPELATEDAAATISVSAFQDESRLSISSLLVTGLDPDGFRRDVVRDTLIAFEFRIPRTGVRFRHNPIYALDTLLTNPLGPFTVDPPIIEGLPQRPMIRWFGPRKVGPDTIRLRRGDDLVLRVDTSLGFSLPTPQSRSWGVEIVGGFNRFVVGANGLPPAVITVPAMWIPPPPDTIFLTTLTFSQSGVVRVPNYRGLYNHFMQMRWTVIVQ